MDKQREIEQMAKKICKSSSNGCNFPTCSKCGIKDTCKARIYATRAVNASYGDTKQAQIEVLKELKVELGNYRCIERTQLLEIISDYIARLEN